jgi:hypothetical protein
MGLASALGQTFKMPVSQVTGRGGGQGRYGQEQEAQGSVLGAPPSGLQNVDNVTRDFYQKWADLESFASDMKMRFGIDVTKPDFSSQEAMEAHEMFQKAAADLHYQSNRLKQAQTDLSLANKAMAGSQGYRYSIDGDPTQQVYDPSMLQMAPPEQKLGSQPRTLEDRLAEYRGKKKIDAEFDGAEGTSDDPDFQVYKDIGQTLAKIGNKELPWNIEEDGTMSSGILDGSKYGTTSNAGIIRKITYDPDTDEVRLHYGSEEDDKSIEVNAETQDEIYRNLVLGQTKLKPDVAARYVKSIAEEGKSIFDLVPEEARGSFDKATQEREKFVAGEKQKIVDEIIGGINNYSSTVKNLMNEKLVGQTVLIKNEAGELEEDVIKKIEKSNLAGEYKISFENGDPIRVGGGRAENNYIIEDFLAGQTQPVEEAVSELDPNESYEAPDGKVWTIKEIRAKGEPPYTDEEISKIIAGWNKK